MTKKKFQCAAALLLAMLSAGTVGAQQRRGAPQLVRIRVRAGERVRVLAERFNVTAEAIARLNNFSEDAELQPGTEVLMPSTSTARTAPARGASTAEAFDRALRARAAQYEPYMRAAAARYGVDPRALWAIAYLESRFRTELVSPKGARGMMQFMPATSARFGLGNPHDATAAIDAAARYVRYLADRFNNRFDLVLAGYNAGEGAVDAYLRGVALRTSDGRIINPRGIQTGGIPPYSETRNYVATGLQVVRSLAQSNPFAGNVVTGRGLLVTPSPDVSDSNERVDDVVQKSAAEEALQTPYTTPTSAYAANEQPLEARQSANTQANRVNGIRSFRPATAARDASSNSNRTNTREGESAAAANDTQPRSTYIRASAPRR